MDILYKIFIDPFMQMGGAPDLLVQTLWDGLVAGVLYALIALGFVLIFHRSLRVFEAKHNAGRNTPTLFESIFDVSD